jgi:CheY-like chemotaxis protein
LIEQIGPDKPLGRDLREIQAAAERAATLTRQLLAFSRKQVFQMEPVDLNAIVGRLKPLLSRLLGERITIATELADELHYVLADASQLEHLIINLALNARDAMPEGGSITVSTGNVELGPDQTPAEFDLQAGAYAMVSVTDTGTGMSPEIQAKIFEPFFTTKELGHGTGLGLAAIYGTVKQLGGAIVVTSAVGKGSTFTIYLPRTAQRTRTSTPASRTGSVPGNETILLVEDERGVRAFTKTALQRFGYRVIEAESAEAAMSLLEKEDTFINLLLTDIVLPKMDGRELASRLTRTQPDIPVLLMSGYSDTWARTGEHHYPLIEKPFPIQALLTKIRHLLGSS